MRNKLLSKISAALATGAMAVTLFAGSIMPAFAADFTYTPVAGGSVTMDKFLVMDGEANVPNAEFTFTIAPGSAMPASAGNLPVFAGPSGATIGSATFAPGDTTYTTVQDRTSTVNGQMAANTKDNVTLGSGQKYAKDDVAISFTGVNFPKPGVYRYVVTEQNSSISGVTNDSTSTRYLDVYVEDQSGSLVVTGYVLHNSASAAAVSGALASGDTKDGGFTNSYTSYDLDLAKAISGNQASKDEFFEFTVAIAGAAEGTVYDVEGNYSATTTVTASSPVAHTNADTLTVGADGTVTATYWLQGGQNISIKGLAPGTTYTISENKTTMNNEGYTTAITSANANVVADNANFTAADSTGIAADTSILFTNSLSGVIPTGIIMSIIPYIVIGALVVLFFVMTAKKKKKN